MKNLFHSKTIYFLLLAFLFSCQQEETEDPVVYSDDIYDLKECKPEWCLSDYRTGMHNETVDGTIMLKDTISPVYASLTIGNKFRPNIGGIFEIDDASDESQIDLQPVFLVKTREGLYASSWLPVLRAQAPTPKKIFLQWQDLKEE